MNKAIANFQKSIGSTFQSHNIEIKETSSNVKTLKITTPASADTDSGGWTKSNPRVTLPVVNPAPIGSLTGQQ